MRPSCTFCTRKHLAQAIVLLGEFHQGYPDHFWFVLGHLAEASDELVRDYPGIANRIRFERKRLEQDRAYKPDLLTIIKQLEHPDLSDTAASQAIDDKRGDAPFDVPPPRSQGAPLPHQAYIRHAALVQSLADEEPLKLLIPTPAPVEPPCTPCEAEKKRQAYGKLAALDHAQGTPWVGRLVILTTLNDFTPSYSLATCALEQARAAASLGYRVHIWTMESVKPPTILPPGVTVDPVIPSVPFADDVINAPGALVLVQTLNGYIGALVSATPRYLVNH